MAVNVRVHGNTTKLHSNVKIDFHLKRSFKKQLRTDGGVIVSVSEYSVAYEQPASVIMNFKAIHDEKACKKNIWNLLSGWKISSTIIEFLSREIVLTGSHMMIRNADNNKAKYNNICTNTGLNLVVELEVVRVDLVEKFETSSEVVHGVALPTLRSSPWRSGGGGGSRSSIRRRSCRESVPVVEFKLKGGMLEKCRLCKEELSSTGVELIHLPNCNHAFHKTCILQWFVDHNSCPSCLNLKVVTSNTNDQKNVLTRKVHRYAPRRPFFFKLWV